MKLLSRSWWRRNRADYQTLKQSPLFDGNFFRVQANLKVYQEPALEYARKWHHYRQPPSPFFDQHHYLKTNPDVVTSGVNPLLHYLRHGFAERRAPLPNFNMGEFYAAHPELIGKNIEPVAYCLERYGCPHWDTQRARWVLRDAGEYTQEDLSAARALFDDAFYMSMYCQAKERIGDPFLHYLTVGTLLDHNPYPGFDNSYYQANNMRPGIDLDAPLIHYVRMGRAAGFATAEDGFKIFPEEVPTLPTPPKVLVHAHLYYPELIAEFLPAFRNFPATTQFVITTCREADAASIRAALDVSKLEASHTVVTVSNRGRDILPFLKALDMFRQDVDFALHVHSKVSPHIDWGTAWRHYLIEMIMGSPELVQNALATLTDPGNKTGCLYPENYHQIKIFLAQEHNSTMLKDLIELYDIHPNEQAGSYPASSFAWYRVDALAPLLDRQYTDKDFDAEKGQFDGTLAHAFERFLPMIVRNQGYTVETYTSTKRPSLRLDTITLPQKESSHAEVTPIWARDTPAAAKRPPKDLTPTHCIFNKTHLDIHWVIPSFSEGAGGHMSIFRIVRYLEQFGHNQTIWVQNALNQPDQETAKKRIQSWYQPIGDRVAVRFLPEDVQGIMGDVLIATDAWTAFPAAQMTGFLERFYFIQDVETLFHPTGENQLAIDQTYKFGFSALTAGPWLKDFARSRGMWVRDWPLCADLSVYKPLKTRSAKATHPIKIAFYARQYTPRRAARLGYAAFEELRRRGIKFHVYLFGEENLGETGDFPQTRLGILSEAELAQLYNDSDIGVVFSTTNYSLLPLEMAACGLPVVDLDVDSMRAVFGDDEITLAEPTPYGVADAIEAVIDNPKETAKKCKRALQKANSLSWEDSARHVESALVERLKELGFQDRSKDIAAQIGTPALVQPTRASVLIPTYNGGDAFKPVLEAVCNQKLDIPYDVVVIDSSSSDATPDIVKRAGNASGQAKNVRLITIDQSEFQHGATRNRGIAESDGSHVAILTQDATPANESWLAHLLSGFAQGDHVAGVIGRHKAYPSHGPFIERDMEAHFDALQALGSCLNRKDGLPSRFFPMSPSWQMLLYFYSDNNSAIAKAAWDLCPYPNIDWGEDYVWARKMMNLGWQKAYVDAAIVYHSHDFEGIRTASAAEAEGRFWKTHFGFDLHKDAEADIAAAIARDTSFAIKNDISKDFLYRRKQFLRVQVLSRIKGAKLKT